MSNISKHYTEKEGESNDGKNGWVHFFVHWDTVGVNDFLESEGKLVHFQVGRGLDGVVLESFEICSHEVSKAFLYMVFFFTRAPEIADIGCLALFHIIESMI